MMGEIKIKTALAIFALLVVSVSQIAGLERTVCETMEIRHSKNLQLLEKCTVIDGNLIVIIPVAIDDNYDETWINSQKFPKLR
jgi:hypothetical protein